MSAGPACSPQSHRKISHHISSPVSFFRQKSTSSSVSSIKLGPPPFFRSPRNPSDHEALSVSSRSSMLSYSQRTSSVSSGQSSPYNRPSVVTSTSIDRKRSKISFEENCCFCEEPLLNVFEGETLLDMSCGHHCHFECYSELFSSPSRGKTTVYCPICGTSNTCKDDEINDSIIRSRLLSSSSCEFNQDIFASTPATLRNQITPLAPFPDLLTPVTPVLPSFPEFSQPSPKAQPLFYNSPIISTFPSTISTTPSSSVFPAESLAEAKIEIIPEFSKIVLANEHAIPKYYDLSCVLNIKSLDYEPSLSELPEDRKKKEWDRKQEISKAVIHNFESRLRPDSDLDVAKLGHLVLFDIFVSVSIDGNRYHHPQVYFFDRLLLILNESGNELIQNISIMDKLSTVFDDESNLEITLNLASLTVPDVELKSENKLIHDKWLKMLSRVVRKAQRQPHANPNNPFVAENPFEVREFGPCNLFSKDSLSLSKEVPSIQMSTNAWGLLERNEKVIPEEVLKFNKLVSKGLDLPLGFVKRQVSKPDADPLILILVIPMVNNGNSCLDDTEYTSEMRQLITQTLERLQPEDKLGLVFLGNKRPDSLLGNYYGCMSPHWEGWAEVISNIECYTSVTGDEVQNSDYNMWQDGLKYVSLLATTSFPKTGSHIHEIIFIHTERVKTVHYFEENSTVDRLWGRYNRKPQKSVSEMITALCDKHCATFHSVSLFDEYTYHPQELLDHYHGIMGSSKTHVRRSVEHHLVLDFDNLQLLIKKLISQFHNVSISQLRTQIEVCEGVRVMEIERNGRLETADLRSLFEVANLNNIPSSFAKSTMINVRIDLSAFTVEELKQGLKVDLLRTITSVDVHSGRKQFKGMASIRMSLDTAVSNASTMPLNLLVTNAGLEKSQFSLPIVARLSAVKDAVFVKRQIELLINSVLLSEVFSKKTYCHSSKEEIRTALKNMMNKVWELVKSCNSSNTSNMRNIEEWSETLNDEVQQIIDGYSMRNYNLSNYCCVAKYFEFI
ncbi:hypothetical protein KL914_001849 [Ogataea haglerorum]|nr:hypothetical protein KL914_001849 [Ogataea haglerorum]